jgi:hypothetical protein
MKEHVYNGYKFVLQFFRVISNFTTDFREDVILTLFIESVRWGNEAPPLFTVKLGTLECVDARRWMNVRCAFGCSGEVV